MSGCKPRFTADHPFNPARRSPTPTARSRVNPPHNRAQRANFFTPQR